MGQARMRVITDPFEEPLPLADMLAVYETFFHESGGGSHQTWDAICQHLPREALGSGDSFIARMHAALEALQDVGLLIRTNVAVGAGSMILYTSTNNIQLAMRLVKENHAASDR